MTQHPITQVRIIPNDKGSPAGKLADAELWFGQDCPTLAGLKLVGFAVWQRRTGTGRNVTFPARAYSVNGERRTFALLRPMADQDDSDRMRDLILDAYRAYEDHGAETYSTTAAQAQAQAPQLPSFAPSLPVFAGPAADAQTSQASPKAETPRAALDSPTTTSPAEDLAL